MLDQFERWRMGERPDVESYLRLVPELGSDPGRLLDVVYNEILLREAAGERPKLKEYLSRFPDLAVDLRRQFEVHSAIDWSAWGDAEETATQPTPRIEGYRIDGELGRGTYGAVYKAWELSLKRFVAIKLIDSAATGDSDASEQFAEAQAIARLTHPNIVQVHAVGRCDAGIYLVQELVEEGTLAEFIQGRPQDPRATAIIVATLADAIHFAHLRGVIHCDLKPSNILLRSSSANLPDSRAATLADFQPKISDFGLARTLDTEQFVETHHVTGTLQYMSPEQTGIEGSQIGPASDVYALGAILYELLTGRPPFAGDSKLSVFLKVRRELPADPRSLLRNVPDDLVAVCMKCLAKEPRQRYATAELLADDLRRYSRGFAPSTVSENVWGKATRWARRRPSIAGLSLALFLTSVICALALISKHFTDLAAEQRRRQQVEEQEAGAYRREFRSAWAAWQAGDTSRSQRLLAETDPARRSFEWHYLNSLFESTSSTMARCDHAIQHLAMSPDGRWLAVSDGFSKISLIDRVNGDALKPFNTATDTKVIAEITFSSDSSKVAAGFIGDDDNWIQTWDVPSGKELLKIGPISGNVCAAVFSDGDTRLVTAAWVDAMQSPVVTVRDWVDSFEPPKPVFGGAARLVTHAGRLTFETWDTKTGTRLGGVVGPNIQQTFTPRCRIDTSGKRMAWTPSTELRPGSPGRHEVQVVDMTTGKPLLTLAGHTSLLHGLSFATEAQLLATFGEDGDCIVWSTSDGKEVRRFSLHGEPVLEADISGDGRRIAIAEQGPMVHVWDVASGKEMNLLSAGDAESGAEVELHQVGVIQSLRFSSDGKSLFGGDRNHAIIQWDLGGHETLRYEFDHGVTRIAFDSQSKGLYLSRLGGKLEWMDLTLAGDEGSGRLKAIDADCLEFAFAPSVGQIAMIASSDGTVRSAHTDGELALIDQGRFDQATANGDAPICWSPDGAELTFIAKDSRSVRSIDARHKQQKREFSAGEAAIVAIACGDRNLLAAACSDRRIRLWNRDSGKLVRVFESDESPERIALRPGGDELASVGRQSSRCEIWHCDSNTRRVVLEGHQQWINGLAYTPDGKRLITCGEDRTVRVWDADSGEELLVIDDAGQAVRRLAISGDSRRLAVTSGQDIFKCSVIVWGERVR
ncbi:MAG: WD40 repeat domain-containing serine/threonine-protein kinase [Pirellulales bacterium]